MTIHPTNLRPVDQLASALATGCLPRGAREMGERVLERLSAPVRLAVLGRPDAGLSGTVNALLGGEFVPDRPGLPPVELSFGTASDIHVVTGDGRQAQVDRAGFDRLDPWSLAMVKLTAPLPVLEQMSFLLVPLEGSAHDLDTAIGWTARRSDMTIWCSGALDESERVHWQKLPETMTDHTFLAVTGQVGRSYSRPSCGSVGQRFRATHFLGAGGDHPARLERFRTELLDHVSAARREDLEGALVFLDRYQPAQGFRASANREIAQQEPPDFSELLDPITPEDDAESPDRVADQPAAEIVTFLAAQAGELADLCDAPSPGALEDAASAVLDLCAESIEACNEMAMTSGGPVVDVLSEASDLVLLMQIEATPEAMTDAVALMVQLRHECETLLCA